MTAAEIERRGHTDDISYRSGEARGQGENKKSTWREGVDDRKNVKEQKNK